MTDRVDPDILETARRLTEYASLTETLAARVALALQAERAAGAEAVGTVLQVAEATASQLLERARVADARVVAVVAERDEARRVARVLATLLVKWEEDGYRELEAVRTALAYPAQRPEPREPSEGRP